MSRPNPQPRRPADPSLRERPNEDPLRPFGLPKWLGLLLYAFFRVVLIVPQVRRWRRAVHWNRVRLGAGAVGLSFLGAGWLFPSLWLLLAGGLLAMAALVLAPAKDPDRERKLQAAHGADYLLNGGILVHGSLPGAKPLEPRQQLYLLLRGPELLIVPVEGSGDVHSVIDVRSIVDVRVAGEGYVPIYVSEAKDPPVRETAVDSDRVTDIELVFESSDTLRFAYKGAFSKHLAETAAHAIYSVRNLARQEAEGGTGKTAFQIVS